MRKSKILFSLNGPDWMAQRPFGRSSLSLYGFDGNEKWHVQFDRNINLVVL